MGRHVFVSYSRKDQDYTRKVVDELQKRGFEVWIDDRIDFGDRWWRTIVEAIESCSAFVVVMTPDSEKSEWVEREVHLAMRERKPIFPLLLRGKEFALLIDRQYVNVRDSRMPPKTFYRRLGQEVTGRDVELEAALEPEEELVAGIEPEREERAEAIGLEDLPPAITVGDVEFVLIPPGEFTMGSDKGVRRDAKPAHKVYLDAFYIGKYPVTNAQYSRFVYATGHQAPRHWSAGSIPEGKEDHPVVWVSWHDARAYCRWLADETGQAVRLPTEAEWEKAARGTDGRKYPWGDRFDKSRCNTKESGIGDTTPVGQYSPRGDSPYGVSDMAGNVWECTGSLHKDYPYDPDDGREDSEAKGFRAIRGGSFYADRSCARVPYRGGTEPDSFFFGLDGFRVALLPPGLPNQLVSGF